jgi:putative transposase
MARIDALYLEDPCSGSRRMVTDLARDGIAVSCERMRNLSDQECQFTSATFVARLQAEEIKISWSGRRRCQDNILVERLWRTLKHEEVYLRAYSDGWDADFNLARFLWRYSHIWPHSSLGARTPHAVDTEIEPYSSCPELTVSRAETVQ